MGVIDRCVEVKQRKVVWIRNGRHWGIGHRRHRRGFHWCSVRYTWWLLWVTRRDFSVTVATR